MTRILPQNINEHRSYTIRELSKSLNVHKKTILRWIDAGLKIIDGSQRPILISGKDLKVFLRNKNSKKKIKLDRHQFYCFKCKGPVRAKRGSTTISGSLKKATCSVCNGKIRRTIKPYQKDYKIPRTPVQMSFLNNN